MAASLTASDRVCKLRQVKTLQRRIYRMSVAGPCDVLAAGPVLQRQGRLRNSFAGVLQERMRERKTGQPSTHRGDDVHAQDLVGLSVSDELHKAARGVWRIT